MLSIETFILVAIWDEPAFFQGKFTLTRPGYSLSKHYLFSCYQHHNPQQQQFELSQLYEIINDSLNTPRWIENGDNALYVLSYALKQTIELLKQKPGTRPIYFDAQALKQLNHQLIKLESASDEYHPPSEMGFAATIDFNPKDKIGQHAAQQLYPLHSLN